jgi:hypothetical protein
VKRHWLSALASVVIASGGCHSHAAPSDLQPAAQPACNKDVAGLMPLELRKDLEALVDPPIGWRPDEIKQNTRHVHQVWLSPSGNTAYGVIMMKLPWPVGPDLLLWAFLDSMKQTEGQAQVIARQKDNSLPGYRLVLDGSHYRIRCTLIVHDWRAWAVYAGTVRSAPILEDELELAEKARDDTKVGAEGTP